MLEAGAAAPEISLKSHDGDEVTLSQYRGKWVVLHTFPLAFTGG
ncbi:MAG: peroxiredoxin Q/BCP [Gammaproteobacteria bacterium]|jgi:peroxiredoxin Q/BCP